MMMMTVMVMVMSPVGMTMSAIVRRPYDIGLGYDHRRGIHNDWRWWLYDHGHWYSQANRDMHASGMGW